MEKKKYFLLCKQIRSQKGDMKNEVIVNLHQMKDPNRRYAIVPLFPLIYDPAVCGKRNVMKRKATGSRPWLVEGLFALQFICQ